MANTVLLDSGFLIRLMNPNEPLHRVALDLFKDYVSSGVTCMVSTVALAEYRVKGDLRYLPTKYLQFFTIPVSSCRSCCNVYASYYSSEARAWGRDQTSCYYTK